MPGEVQAVGVIGCGMVSHAYIATILRAPGLRLAAVSSRSMASAHGQAARYDCAALTTEQMLADPEIAFVLNLAPPSVHHAIGRQVLEAGKHLYSEKPFATRLRDAEDLVSCARSNGVAIGCAPDTFLGEAHQAARRLVDIGAIGRVTGGAVAMMSSGMEAWHPNPAFFYAEGGGPLLDVGPYYVAQLVNLLGPIREVVAIGSRARDVRLASSPGRTGEIITVEVPTTINGALLFEGGANVAVSLSWDVSRHWRSPIELYGETGTLITPDPNHFTGSCRIGRAEGDWERIGPAMDGPSFNVATLASSVASISRGYDPRSRQPLSALNPLETGDRRGLGLLDLVEAVHEGRMPRASGALALHVLEVLLALETSAIGGGRVPIFSRVERPAPVTMPT